MSSAKTEDASRAVHMVMPSGLVREWYRKIKLALSAEVAFSDALVAGRTMLRVKRLLIGGAFCAAALAPANAWASDDTDSLTVSAHVVATCEITANDLDFGDYNPVVASNLDAATTVSLTCTNGTSYAVGMSLGDNVGSTVATRYMDDNNSHMLGYTLYQNAGRTTLWGASSNTLAGTGTGSAATINVYGRIAMNQTVPTGNYSDTIVVTVTW